MDYLIYKERVREFFECASIKYDPLRIITLVKNKEIEVSSEYVGKALNIPNEGVQVYEETWYEKDGITQEEYRTTLFKDPSLFVTAPNLIDMVRILHHICSHTLLPRAGSFEKVTPGDSILYHLVQNK